MPLDEPNLKGFNHPALAVEILRWREEADAGDVEVAPAEAPAAKDMRSRPRDTKRPSRALSLRPKEGAGTAGCPLHPQPPVQR
jgi:hypothetical protein